METEANITEHNAAEGRIRRKQQFDALKVLGKVKNLFGQFKARHQELISQNIMNGGTGEETITLNDEVDNSNDMVSQRSHI